MANSTVSAAPAASSDSFKGYVSSSFGFRGRSVPCHEFVWGSPVVLSDLRFDAARGVLSVHSSLGSLSCVVRYLPPAEVEMLCDAVAEAVSSGESVCLARVPGAAPRWFCSILPASAAPDTLQEQGALGNPRPWAGFGQ